MAAFHTPTQHYYAGSVTGGSSASSSNPFYSPQYDAGSGAPGYYSRTSSWGSTSTSSSTSPYGCGGNSGPSDGALILYNPAATLGGLYYSDDMHGPFATGRTHNPFVPGLEPTAAAKPMFQTVDPMSLKYPSTSQSTNDPFAWVGEHLFNISAERAALNQDRAPLRQLSAYSRPAA